MSFAHDILLTSTTHDVSNPIHLGGEAANDATKAVTLDVLVAQHGAPSPGYRFLAFAGYDPTASLALGQKVASERILRALPGFVQSASLSWEALDVARRKLLVGFAPGLLAALLAESVTLRELNARYDRAAKSDALSRARAVSLADETLRSMRHSYAQSLRMVGEFMSAQQWSELGFATLPDAPDGPDRLGLALDTLSSQTGRWLATLPADVRGACDEMGVGDGLVEALRAGAATLRQTQAELAGLTETTRVTQRQLDEQDGRVLHVVRVIFTAFRLAARKDTAVVVPDLGDLESVFVRDRRPSASEKTDDATDTPVVQPTPAPQPVPPPTPT